MFDGKGCNESLERSMNDLKCIVGVVKVEMLYELH